MSLKKLFLLSPLLWFRKIIVYLLGLFIILAIVVYFIANSPWAIHKVADMFAPDYNITYSRIYGNVLTGVEIEDLKYNEHFLAKHASVKWNPDKLLRKQIMINHINLDKVNIDTIKSLVNTFSSDSNESTSPLSFDVKVSKIDIGIDSFVENNITIKNVLLHAKDFYYDNEVLEVTQLELVIDSNISQIMLNASLKKGLLNVKNLEIKALNLLALQTLLHSDDNTSSVDKISNEETETTINPLLPQKIAIQNLNLSIVPVTYDPLEVRALKLYISKGIFDVEKLLLEKAHLEANMQTNLANAEHRGDINKNQLEGILLLHPKKALFTSYDIPIREKSLETIKINLNASQEQIVAAIDTKVLQVLNADKDGFNIDIDRLQSKVSYSIQNGILEANSAAKVTTPYAKDIHITNNLKMTDTLSYSGDVFVKKMIGIDAKFVKPVDNLKLTYTGDRKSIQSTIDAAMVKGHFVTSDFKKAKLHIESKKEWLLKDFVSLPAELNASKATLVIDIPFQFDTNTSFFGKAKIASDLASIDANISYRDTLHVQSLIDVPETSQLRTYNQAVKWENILPLKADITLLSQHIKAKVKAGKISTNAKYDLNTTAVEGTVDIAGLKATLSGIAEKKININSDVTSVSSLIESISKVYTLEKPPSIDGSANFLLEITALEKIDLALKSPLLIYHADHKTSTQMKDIDLLLHYEDEQLTVKHYNMIYDKEHIYATKSSTIMFKENLITIQPLWVNDQLKAEGTYDLKTREGKMVAKADNLHFVHEIIDLDSQIDLDAVMESNKTKVKGKVIILGGDIHYDISQKSFASDSDIIIVQDMKKDNNNSFMSHLSMNIQVKTKKNLLYNKGAIHMKAQADLTVLKEENSDMMVLGSIEILEGSTYIFQNKKFVLEKSFVHFTGNINKPLLDIKVKYKAINHLVTVKITGSADMPNIAFSSKPSLTKEQILSLILFDTETAAGTNTGDDMMKMMGGAMAKAALNDMGIKIDHLVIGEGNSVEVGKKIGPKATVIYINGETPEVKLKYEHNQNFESIIGASERSQSYDIIFKKDF